MPVILLVSLRRQCMLHFTRTFGAARTAQSACRDAASALEIQNRGIEIGIEMNLASASPRMVVSGSMKITASAPSRGAFSHSEPELNSISTTLPGTS